MSSPALLWFAALGLCIAFGADFLGGDAHVPSSWPVAGWSWGRIPWEALREIGGGLFVASAIGWVLVRFESDREVRMEAAAADRSKKLALMEHDRQLLMDLTDTVRFELNEAHRAYIDKLEWHHAYKSGSPGVANVPEEIKVKTITELWEARQRLAEIVRITVFPKLLALSPEGTPDVFEYPEYGPLATAVVAYQQSLPAGGDSAETISESFDFGNRKPLMDAMAELQTAATAAIRTHRSRIDAIIFD